MRMARISFYGDNIRDFFKYPNDAFCPPKERDLIMNLKTG
jgi:hypothetical protein